MRVLILSIIVLSLLLVLRYLFYLQTITNRVGSSLEVTISLLADPQDSFAKQVFQLQGVRIEAPDYPVLRYGDKLSVSGVIEERTFTPQGTDKEVKLLVIENPVIKKLPQDNIFIFSASFLRNRVYNSFKSQLSGNEATLLFGIVFGGSSGFSSEMKEAFRNTGVLHVVAASGMNVSMVGAFLLSAFSRIFHRRTALLFTIMGIFYYSLISGFQPSILRAAIMASVALSAAYLGRQAYGFLTLFLTAWVMLIFTPETLFQVGFLLSFTATFGILLIKPVFDQVSLVKRTQVVSDDIATTVSAQLGSLPVMVGVFSTYSFISILINALVLWTIPFLMILGGIAAFCAIVLPFLSFIPLYGSLPLLWYFEKVITIFGSVPLLTIEGVSVLIWISYYFLLVSVVLFVKQRGKK